MANPTSDEPDALMCARPDLWEPWAETPKATRPCVSWRAGLPNEIQRQHRTSADPVAGGLRSCLGNEMRESLEHDIPRTPNHSLLGVTLDAE